MKIDDTYQNINLISNSRESASNIKAEEDNELTRGSEKGGQPGASVDFSNTSVEVSRAAEMMEKEQVERAEKINEIKTKIKDGTYNIDANKVADKILKDSLAYFI